MGLQAVVDGAYDRQSVSLGAYSDKSGLPPLLDYWSLEVLLFSIFIYVAPRVLQWVIQLILIIPSTCTHLELCVQFLSRSRLNSGYATSRAFIHRELRLNTEREPGGTCSCQLKDVLITLYETAFFEDDIREVGWAAVYRGIGSVFHRPGVCGF